MTSLPPVEDVHALSEKKKRYKGHFFEKSCHPLTSVKSS